MNIKLIDFAKAKVPNVPVLINMVSKRVQQLNAGFAPFVRPLTHDEEKVDIALREIGEGKLVAEIDFSAKLRENPPA